jgi:hypothetical protein
VISERNFEALPEQLSVGQYRTDPDESKSEHFRLHNFKTIVPIGWLLDFGSIRLNAIELDEGSRVLAVHQRLVTTGNMGLVSGSATIQVVVLFYHDNYWIGLTQDHAGMDEHNTDGLEMSMVPSSAVQRGNAPDTFEYPWSLWNDKPGVETMDEFVMSGFEIVTATNHQPGGKEDKCDLQFKGEAGRSATAIDLEDQEIGSAIDCKQTNSGTASKTQETLIIASNSLGAPGKLSSFEATLPVRLALAEDSKHQRSSHNVGVLSESRISDMRPSELSSIPKILDFPDLGLRDIYANNLAQKDSESECTDGDEDVSHSTEPESEFGCPHIRTGGTIEGLDVVHVILERARDELLDAFMGKFWGIANQRMSENIRVYASCSSTSSASKSDVCIPHGSSSNVNSSKRSGEQEEDDFREEDEDRRAKKPKLPSASTVSLEESAQFGCPYRKHDPKKYNFRDWPTCALIPQRTVARVKYAPHAIFLKLKI